MIFGEFLVPPAPPRIEPKSKKSEKIRWKPDIQKEHAFQQHSSWFFTVLTSENGSEIDDFLNIVRKCRFSSRKKFWRKNLTSSRIYTKFFLPARPYSKNKWGYYPVLYPTYNFSAGNRVIVLICVSLLDYRQTFL